MIAVLDARLLELCIVLEVVVAIGQPQARLREIKAVRVASRASWCTEDAYGHRLRYGSGARSAPDVLLALERRYARELGRQRLEVQTLECRFVMKLA